MRSAWRQVARLGPLAVLLTACASHPPVAPVRGEGASADAAPVYYTVIRGDTLYSIAFRYGHDYRELAAWNGIRPPYRIFPGQRLRIDRAVAVQARSASGRTAAVPAALVRQRHPHHAAPAGAPAARIRHRASGSVAWSWPTQGRILRTFSADAQGKKGVDIGGRPGQPIDAAARGKVVYSGSGLVGYGQLIIVKHDNDYLSAYAHNRKLLVKQGDEVRRGQQIAEMGSTGTDRVMLHFEIRRDGKPVDPLRFLPPL